MRKSMATVVALVLVVMAMPVAASAKDGGTHKFASKLSGAEVVPPEVTDATGKVKLTLNKDGSELAFTLRVKNTLASGAQIRCAPSGVNGPVGVTLFARFVGPDTPTKDRGVIVEPDFENGCGWADLDDVVAALRSGDTYLDVHTFDGGEIRGQLD